MINIHLYPSAFLNESRILREAGSLSKLGIFDRIDLVGIGGEGLRCVEQVRDGVRIVRLARRGGGGLMGKVAGTGGWSQAVYLRYRRERIACINCHSVATLPLGVMLKRATGARLVYDAHELETETNGLSGVRQYLTRRVERALIPHADHCIFVGQGIERWYRDQYGLTNTTVLYNCPPRQQARVADHFRQAFPIAPGMPIFLYQGVIGEGRGIRMLVEAFAGLAGRAVLVVMGYGALAGWFVGEAERRHGMYFHPAVPPDRLLEYTASADYGLSVIEGTSLSYDYCMPNKLFEYVMAGKPVLVSPTREQSEFVRTHGIGEVAEGTAPSQVREAALRLLGREPAALRAALARTAAEYCWEGQEANLESVYLDSLGFRARQTDRAPRREEHHDFCH